MKICNINVQHEIAQRIVNLDIPQFVLDVVRPLEMELVHNHHLSIIREMHYDGNLPHSPIRKFVGDGYQNVANLLHTIPIYLLDSCPKKYSETDIVDLLGAYFPNTKNDNPYIELYLSNIDNASKGDDVHFKWIFTQTLIHELAHSALDIFNIENCRNPTEKVLYCTEFGRWREESMANAITLSIIRESKKNDFYDFCKQFMLSQPSEYALGVLMEEFHYRDFWTVVYGKKNGVHVKLQEEWLKVVQNNPTPDILHQWNEYLSSEFVYIYNDKYYTEEKGLVFDIVTDVLKEYQSSNGKKMSVAEFKTKFPHIRTGAEMSYELSESVQGDSRYTQIELEDGNVSLYYWWNNEHLHEFVNNINCSFIEYKNN